MSRFSSAYNVIDEYRLARSVRDITIPVNTGMSAVKAGTGKTVMTPSVAYVASGETNGGSAILYSYIYGLYPSSTTLYRGNLNKRKVVSFLISVSGDNAQNVRYAQIRQDHSAPTLSDLTAGGYGIKINNLSMVGESYGTERGEVALMTLAEGLNYLITIDHYPAEGRIDWYVDGVLKGVQATAAAVPNAVPANPLRFVASVSNGTNDADARLYFSPIHVIEGV